MAANCLHSGHNSKDLCHFVISGSVETWWVLLPRWLWCSEVSDCMSFGHMTSWWSLVEYFVCVGTWDNSWLSFSRTCWRSTLLQYFGYCDFLEVGLHCMKCWSHGVLQPAIGNNNDEYRRHHALHCPPTTSFPIFGWILLFDFHLHSCSTTCCDCSLSPF